MPKPRQRRPLPSKLRFEVLKRDGFICTYCGRKSPDVELHVDHVVPVASGGTDTLSNLVTACSDCNFGKGATPLDDDSVQRWEAEQLAEKARQDQLQSEFETRAQDFLTSVQDFNPLVGFLSSLRDGWSVLGLEECRYLQIAQKLKHGKEPTVEEIREASWQLSASNWEYSESTNSWVRQSLRLATILSQVLILHAEPLRSEFKEWVLSIEDEQYQREARRLAQSFESQYREWEAIFNDGFSLKPDARFHSYHFARDYEIGLLPKDVDTIASLVTYTIVDGIANLSVAKHRKYAPTRKGLANAWACYQEYKEDYERAVTYGTHRSAGLLTY